MSTNRSITEDKREPESRMTLARSVPRRYLLFLRVHRRSVLTKHERAYLGIPERARLEARTKGLAPTGAGLPVRTLGTSSYLSPVCFRRGIILRAKLRPRKGYRARKR